MPPWRLIAPPALALVALCGNGAADEEAPAPRLEVRFTDEGVTFSGTVDSKETARSLTEAVKSVRPDLAVINEGLDIDPDSGIAHPGDIESVLAELGLSTHEGRLVIAEDRALIGGLTDSRVTSTALRIRLEPLLENRRLIDRICIVPSEDMPEVPVSLTGSRESVGLDFEKRAPRGPTFRFPGLAMEQLYPVVVMLSDLRRLEGEGDPDRPPEPLRAVPMTRAGGASFSSTDGAGDGGRPLLQAVPAGPVERRASLQPIRFSRNSVLLRAGQRTVLDTVAGQLRDESLTGQPVTLSPVLSEDGPDAFAAYLGERRGEEVRQRLAERGIDTSRVSIEPVSSDSRIDRGEVRVSVELPEPEPPMEETGEDVPEETDDSTPADSPGMTGTERDEDSPPSSSSPASPNDTTPAGDAPDTPESSDPDSALPAFRLRADDSEP